MVTDVTLRYEGNIVLFDLLTDDAREWVDEYVDPEAFFFGRALVVEHRYVANLVNMMLDDGLEVAA